MSAPTLVLHGDADEWVPLAAGKALAATEFIDRAERARGRRSLRP